jgi:cob(I)alamin adenosyltransferase
MLYTRKGDDGTSGLYGTKERLPKNDAMYDALGTLDELNSWVGVCKAFAKEGRRRDELVRKELANIQENLFIIEARLAGAEKELRPGAIEAMERGINGIETMILGRHTFAIAGATKLAGLLDYARAVSRRAERALIAVKAKRALPEEMHAYLNRLSSLLWALARYSALKAGVKEPSPSY